MHCEFPSIQAQDETVKEVLQTAKTIAIVGLSPDESKDSNKVARYLQSVGYKIIPIYPKEDEILGEKVYKTLADVKEHIDIVNVFRKPAVLMDIAKEIITRSDAKVMWSQLGIVNNDAAKLAQENGKIVIQNKCTKIEHQRLSLD